MFAYSRDPVAAGLADSLAKPGQNMTGITFMALELSAKRIEVLKELVPTASRIALLSNPKHAGELAHRHAGLTVPPAVLLHADRVID